MTFKSGGIKGLVLAGGASKRMGQPKAYMKISGKKEQYQVAQEVLQVFCDEVYFSVSPKLVPPLPLESDFLIKDIFAEPIGPLGGLISAFYKFPDASFFVLACDMPFFDQEAAKTLLAKRDEKNVLGTFYTDAEGKVEPLCGIYEKTIFPYLLDAWRNKTYCPRKILQNLPITKIMSTNFSWLKNLNHPDAVENAMVTKESESKSEIELIFYAGLKQEMGVEKLRVKTSAQKISDLYAELRKKYGLSLNENSLRFAKNHQLCGADDSISDGDLVVFLPPVAGG